MIRPCLKKIIENFGFEYVGGEYIAHFYFDATGNILTCIVKEDSDEYGLPIIQFHFFNSDGDFLSKCTLDQMFVSLSDRHMKLVPKKSTSVYVATINVSVTVPVDMKDITTSEYHSILEDYVDDEQGVAIIKARERVGNLLHAASLEYNDLECTDIKEVARVEVRKHE